MHQIFELVDGLYQRVRTFFSSRRAFWDEVRSAFRLFLFTSWDQVLVRMNSPPQPLRSPIRIASASPGPDSCRGSAFPRPDNNHATPPSPGIAMRPAAGSGSLNRAPPGIRSIAPAGSFCPSASPHLAVSALPDFLFRPSTAVHRESLLDTITTAAAAARCDRMTIRRHRTDLRRPRREGGWRHVASRRNEPTESFATVVERLERTWQGEQSR